VSSSSCAASTRARPRACHYLADPRLAHAVGEYLEHERAAVEREITWMGEQSALK